MSKLDRQVVIVQYPLGYSQEDREWLEECIRKGIEETGIVIVPEDIDIRVLPIH